MRYFVRWSLALLFSLTILAPAVLAQSNVTVEQGPPTYEGAWWVGGADGGAIEVSCPDGGVGCFGTAGTAYGSAFPATGLAIGVLNPSNDFGPMTSDSLNNLNININALSHSGANFPNGWIQVGGYSTDGYTNGPNIPGVLDQTVGYSISTLGNIGGALVAVPAEFCANLHAFNANNQNGGFVAVYPGQQAIVQFTSTTTPLMTVSAYGILDRGAANQTQINANAITGQLCAFDTGVCSASIVNPALNSRYVIQFPNGIGGLDPVSLVGVYTTAFTSGGATAQVCTEPTAPAVPDTNAIVSTIFINDPGTGANVIKNTFGLIFSIVPDFSGVSGDLEVFCQPAIGVTVGVTTPDWKTHLPVGSAVLAPPPFLPGLCGKVAGGANGTGLSYACWNGAAQVACPISFTFQ